MEQQELINKLKTLLPQERVLKECSGRRKCNSCEMMMACEIYEEDRQYNLALEKVYKALPDIINYIKENTVPNVGFLRQYLNESSDWKGKLWTDEDLMSFIKIGGTQTLGEYKEKIYEDIKENMKFTMYDLRGHWTSEESKKNILSQLNKKLSSLLEIKEKTETTNNTNITKIITTL